SLHVELQECMNDLVGIIRKAEEIAEALERLAELRQRVPTVRVEGHRQYNPGWLLALALRNMLLVSECVAEAALRRTESRGGHTRDDHPQMDAKWRSRLLSCTTTGEDAVVPEITVAVKQPAPMRQDLLELFELSELEQYYLESELTTHPSKTEG